MIFPRPSTMLTLVGLLLLDSLYRTNAFSVGRQRFEGVIHRPPILGHPLAIRHGRRTDDLLYPSCDDNKRLSLAKRSRSCLHTSTDDHSTTTTDWKLFGLFTSIGLLYWYLMVFGAAAQANGLPVPDFIPMTPGWPATDQDFVPVIEDSYHFFYLSELLGNEEAPYVIPPRLAIFNVVEAWIFAMLPALWKDTNKRLPRPILLGSWLFLGINLTNAFLAPYLAFTETRDNNRDMASGVSASPSLLSTLFPRVFGSISSAVVIYAVYQSTVVATSADWSEFWGLVQTDRSYLAFCVDPIIFAIFQPLILGRIKSEREAIDFVPFIGLVAWLLAADKAADDR